MSPLVMENGPGLIETPSPRGRSSGQGIFYAIGVGALIACSFIMLRSVGVGGGIALFGVSSVIVSLAHLACSPRAFVGAVGSVAIAWRGVMLGVTQILVCQALRGGDASAAIVAGTVGSGFGMMLGYFVLKERLVGRQWMGIALSAMGAVCDPALLHVSGAAVAAGCLTGANATFTRALFTTRALGKSRVVAGTLFWAGVASLGWSVSPWAGEVWITPPSVSHVVAYSAVLAAIQYGSCLVYEHLDTQRTAIYCLSRIPVALVVEFALLSVVPTPYRLASSALVIAGAAVVAWNEAGHKSSRRGTMVTDVRPIQQRSQ